MAPQQNKFSRNLASDLDPNFIYPDLMVGIFLSVGDFSNIWKCIFFVPYKDGVEEISFSKESGAVAKVVLKGFLLCCSSVPKYTSWADVVGHGLKKQEEANNLIPIEHATVTAHEIALDSHV